MHLKIDVLQCSCLRAEGLDENAEPQSLSASLSQAPFSEGKLICYQHTLWNKRSKKNNGDKNGQKENRSVRAQGQTKQRPGVNCVREHGGSSPEVCAVQGWASEHRVRPTHWVMPPHHSSTPTNPAHPGLHPSSRTSISFQL